MEQLLNEIRIGYIDPDISEIIAAIAPDATNAPYAMRFNQSEEYFIEIHSPVMIPHLSIHHDVRQSIPNARYMHDLRDIIAQLAKLLPECLAGLTYFFDPAEVLKPCFFRLYKAENESYLYLLRIDLLAKPFEGTIIERGTNDATPAYTATRLYMESEIIPLEAVMWENGRIRAFRIKQLISQTWIGETGRGYLVRGIWMDTDLSKFFTKLFIPRGKRIYPFFPLFCKYKTICASAPILSAEGRRAMIPLLHHAIRFLVPELGQIQDAIRTVQFSESLPVFSALRERVPESRQLLASQFTIEPYLNDREQKEYALHHETV